MKKSYGWLKGGALAALVALVVLSVIVILPAPAQAAGTYSANLSPQSGDKAYAKASGGANCFIQAGSPWINVYSARDPSGYIPRADFYWIATTFANWDSIQAKVYVELHAPGWWDEAYYSLQAYQDNSLKDTKSGSSGGDWSGWVTSSVLTIGSSSQRWRFVMSVWALDGGALTCQAKAEFQVVDATVCGSIADKAKVQDQSTAFLTSIEGVFAGFAKYNCQTGTTGFIDFYGSGRADGASAGHKVAVFLPSGYSFAFAELTSTTGPCTQIKTISGNKVEWDLASTGYPSRCSFVVTVGGVTSGWTIPSCGVQTALQVNAYGLSDYKPVTLVFCPAANNNFANQIGITSPSSRIVTTTGATLETGEPRPCGAIGATVWYSFTAGASGTAVIDTVGGSTNYDTVLAAYTGSSLGGLTNKACNDDYSGLQSRISFSCTAGTTYRIQLGGYNGATGRATLDIIGC
ncbi:MAG: hypothetical protein WC985_00285 [Thermoplasmata archaeon]